MDKSILVTLEENAASFSKGQKRIARYILSDLKKAAFLTAAALGKETEVSESTVVRFATELGYEGFPQMQKALQDALVDRFCEEGPDVMPQNLQKETICNVADALASARRIYLIAQGAQRVLADYMENGLVKFSADVHTLFADSGKLRHIGAGDVAVVFSFQPYSPVIAETAASFRSSGAKVIGITNSENAPICSKCDYCLFAHTENRTYGLSFLRPMALVEELLTALGGNEDAI